ncbi:MAG: AAA domain-containing protein [Bacteroidales bacterium]|nr:AAA domain-containing protein [Bacteroidales bacterium]
MSLLRQEYEYEKEQFRLQTETFDIGRKVRAGLCWFPISVGRSYYNALNQYVVELSHHPTDNEEEHQFEYGRTVSFFSADFAGNIHTFPFVATVSIVDGNRMVVSLPRVENLFDLQNASNLGVQLYFDETTYRLMFEALGQAIQAHDNRLAELRDTFNGLRKPTTHHFDNQRFPWLNPTQEQAVNDIIRSKDVAVVHGPPGTGKTTTLVEAISETLHRESQVLVCAQSNMAVDWISERLTDRGITVLRIGNPTRVNDKMLASTFERRFEAHPDYPQLWSIRKAIRELYEQKRRGRTENLRQKISSLRDRATTLELSITESLFAESRVIASTLVGSANRTLAGRRFDTLFIDEAAQALEPACWIAIRKAHRVILAGDHCQLPPTVKSMEAQRNGLGKTLMEHIVDTQPGTVTLLDLQYRMNEDIMRFASDWFYHSRLKAAPEVRHRSILDLDTPMEWIDTSEEEEKEERQGESRVNTAEAALCIDRLKEYIERIGKNRLLEEHIDFGIISPYKAQVELLRKLVKHDNFFRPYRPYLTVNTVDGFQGQERDVIVISLVRSNDNRQIGFLSDLRRMNVAITRARMKVIVMGNADTLTHHKFYHKLHDYIESLKVRD